MNNLWLVSGLCGGVVVSALCTLIWLRRRLARLRNYQDEWDLVISGESDATEVNPDRRRPKGWEGRATTGKASTRRYAEIMKGPDRPSRGRMSGKPGMTNKSERNTLDWQTDMLVNRIVGRRVALNFKKKPPPPPPKKRPKPK